MSQRARTRFFDRQLAARRLMLDGQGKLKPDARIMLAMFRRACHAGRGQRITVMLPGGGVDPVGTVAASARRELYDRFIETLNLDEYDVVNLREED